MIYRAVRNPRQMSVPAALTRRAPANVPILVDNIWEWLRPEGRPSRRYSAFASPDPQSAAQSAHLEVSDVWRVELPQGQMACQIVGGKQPEDARYHEDVRALTNLVLRRQLPKEWFDRAASMRGPESVLFTPCASKEELDSAIEQSVLLNCAEIRSISKFWSDTIVFDPSLEPAPHALGEIFFEGDYRLEPLPSTMLTT